MLWNIQEVDPELVGFKTNYPIGVTKDKYVKWVYRVQKWLLTASGTASASASSKDASASITSSPSSDTLELSMYFGTGETTDEKGYVTGGSAVNFESLYTGQTDSDTGTEDNSFAFASGGIFVNYISIGAGVKSAGLYYPSIYMEIGINAYAYAGYNAGPTDNAYKQRSKGNQNWPPPAEDEYNSSIEITIDDETFMLASRAYDDTEGGGSPVVNVSIDEMTIDIQPTDYWAYNPGSGGSIYDPGSGAQLRDPFSVQTTS